MKDNFSLQASVYARFRPQYPKSLYDLIYAHVRNFEAAWDVGTGNGQVAQALAMRFQLVFATDISARQLEQAPAIPNVHYAVGPAENSGAPDASFDLVVAGQAAHWFKFDTFYREVARVLRPGGLLVLFGYGLLQFQNEALDAAILHFYQNILHGFWDPERDLVDAHYRDLPFPLREITCPELDMQYEWTFAQLIGFLQSWSAVQHYEKAKSLNPLVQMEADLAAAWGEAPVRTVHFPIFIRMGIL